MKPEPEFDASGYPTDATLDRIRSWDHADLAGLLNYCRAAWYYPDYWRVNGLVHHVSTGGWSGNESIIDALEQNAVAWMVLWQKSVRGGHYEFKLLDK